MEITLKDFMQLQPNYPEANNSDKYYTAVANRLMKVWDNAHILADFSDDLRRKIVLAIVGYYQDIIADAGIWRSFSELSEQLYGTPVPLFERPDDYVESELNLIDVQFITWYIIETATSNHGNLSPYNKSLAQLARIFHSVLDAVYEKAPTPVEYNMIIDVDLHNEDEAQHIYDLSYWLFWNSYFMRPAAQPTLLHSMQEAQDIIRKHPDPDEARPFLTELNNRVMAENATGPLSLSIGEWLEMIVNQKFPTFEEDEEAEILKNPHKYYAALTNATGGSSIAFFGTYEALDRFLSENLNWGIKADGHFPAMKGFKNFVILGNPHKGILIAHDVAQFINHPGNPTFDINEAIANGHTLVTRHGTAPIDLVKYLFKNNLVPDIRLPFDTEGRFLHDNWDFLARLYQQSFYRAD